MAKRTKFAVWMGDDHVARFSSYSDAIWFAREVSRLDSPRFAGGTSEVSDRTGLIAQFDDGAATPEFSHLDAA